MTARKQAEQERAHLEGQLRQSQKLQAIGQLAAGVAHDFNSLLMVLLGNLELLQRRREKAEPARTDRAEEAAMEQMLAAVERGRKLVQNLLAFGRTHKTKPQNLDVNQTIANMDAILQGLLEGRIELHTNKAPNLKPIHADAGQIEQAVMNLVINARDAMPEGGTLEIETANVLLEQAYVAAHADAKPGPHVLIAVRDTGHGMTSSTLERLFEPFFTTKPVDKGSGLGLSIVHGIVNQAGGHIEVKSQSGEGSEFELYFPAVE